MRYVAIGMAMWLAGCGLLTDSTRDEALKHILPVAAKALVKAAGGYVDANEAVCFEIDGHVTDDDEAVYVVCRAPVGAE